MRARAELHQATRRARLRRAAMRYAGHGWPVVPGAVLVGARYRCGPLCPTVACHPAVDGWDQRATVDKSIVDAWWRADAFSVLVATGRAFDVLELAAGPDLVATDWPGPLLRAPSGGLMFLLRTGAALHPELAARADVVLHGVGSWIAVPPTRAPVGHLRWIVAPPASAWRLPDAEPVQAWLLSRLVQTPPTSTLPARTHLARRWPTGSPAPVAASAWHRLA
jgi:Bifunctional DNA primase/polymerase, N-terminal